MHKAKKQLQTLPGYTKRGEPYPRQCHFCDEPSVSGVKFTKPNGYGSEEDVVVLGICETCAFKIGYPPDTKNALKVLQQAPD